MPQLFCNSPRSLRKKLEKLQKKNIDKTSKYLYLTHLPFSSKRDSYCYSIEREDKPKKGKLFRLVVITPVNDCNFKWAIEHKSFCNLDDVVYKVHNVSKNYIELENTRSTEIITVVVKEREDEEKDIKKKVSKIKVTKLSNKLIEAFISLDNEKDRVRYLKDLEKLIEVSKGYELKAIKKTIKELNGATK